ncbi:uncharacterized protein LOC110024759 [Phalaenopsis equestris]|uniref:uncharacterized protein LOC110024759 n=1 Tax=Phalaenopsis equestris TaxID=78828 RepID=UPI0009E4E608|nr:uncharacterized protein LOC110024759 [Phalaenopsis equestris]
MEQPKGLAGRQPPQSASVDETKRDQNKRQPPSPEEILTFYESQGLDHRAASLKAIEDLQSALLRGAAASRRNRLAPSGDLQRKVDNINTSLAILQMKLDSKPGFPESLAIGLASGALIHGLSATVRALSEAWRSVASVTKSRSPP